MKRRLGVILLLAFALFYGLTAEKLANAAPPPDPSYIHEYHQVWRIVRDTYLDSGKLSEWQKYEHVFDEKLSSNEQLKAAIESMLDALDDPYTWLREAEEDPSPNGRLEANGKPISCHSGSSSQEASVVAFSRNGIGYIRIDSFHDDDVAQATEDALCSFPPVKAYVLDLRNNHGGMIDEAFSVFSLFCDRGNFVTLRGRRKDKSDIESLILSTDSLRWSKSGSEVESDRRPNLSGTKPIVVLVNSDTRSAAEALAGALRQSRGATLIGEPTYGKGVAQDIIELHDGSAIKLVTAWVELPDGKCFHGKGLRPDRYVASVSRSDMELKVAMAVLQSQ